MKRRDRRDAEGRREKAELATRRMCDSTFFTEIFTEVVLKGRVRIAERPLCGPLRPLRFISGIAIEDARYAHDGDSEITRNWVELAFPGPSIVICSTSVKPGISFLDVYCFVLVIHFVSSSAVARPNLL